MFRKGKLKEYSSLLNLFLILTDFTAAFIIAIISYNLKFTEAFNYNIYLLLSLLWSFLIIVSMTSCNSYRVWRESSILAEIFFLFRPLSLAFTIQLVFGFIIKNTFSFSFIWVLTSAGIYCIYIIISRVFFRGFLKILRAKGYNKKFLLLIASEKCGEAAYKTIVANKNSGFTIQTILSDDLQSTLPLDGNLSCMSEYLIKKKYDQIWIAIPLEEGKKIKDIINLTNDYPVDIKYIPDIFGIRLLNHSFTEFNGLPLINLHSSPLEGFNKVIKRSEDLILASIIVILISPLMILIAVVIKWTSPGPIIYRQTRIGLNNKPFRIMKFRSMPVGTEKSTGAVWATTGENRATKFGSFLRKTSLDELPQFINVLKGNMSIVGPRPERPKFIKVFKNEISYYMKKHFVKAGITGWAQANGWRGSTDLNKRIEYDLYYIEHWSLAFDIKIILMTICRIFKDKNAY